MNVEPPDGARKIILKAVLPSARRFTPAGFSFVPRHLPLSPMRVLAVRIEHALEVPV
jgi:hypothetical protein